MIRHSCLIEDMLLPCGFACIRKICSLRLRATFTELFGSFILLAFGKVH
jgi:hypothetical protein